MNAGDVDTSFRGPFAAGPPPGAMVIDAPPLTRFHLADVGRLLVVLVVVGGSLLKAAAERALGRRDTGAVQTACDGLIDAFIHLGPTFVKAGQIIASSGVLFPDPLVTSARRCLDEVPTFPTSEVLATIEDDLGAPVEEIFASFEKTALSAASIGQVHGCTLHDGREAVVKVQRPNIRDRMARDLRNAHRIAWLFEHSPWGRTSGATGVVRDLHGVTFQELTPAHEAWQQHRFREGIWAFGDNKGVTAPEVYWNYCGPRVICMERVRGVPMDRFELLSERGIDTQLVLRRGAKVWAEAAMIHGPFHGDMHAGNIWVLDDGRGCFLDFGIMGELSDEWKELMRDLFYTCAFDMDFRRVAEAYQRVGALPPGLGTVDEVAAFLTTVIGPMLSDGFGGIDIAQLVAQSLQMLKNFDASVPQELVLVAKQLLYVDRYTKFLASDYSITSDPFVVRNVFPEDAVAKAEELGVLMPD